jgi:uncharacterized membrane protein YhhN
VNRPVTITFIVLTALATAALVWFLRIGWLPAAASAKFLASCGFLATAVSAGALRHGFGRIIFAGLLLSMSGDMFLIGLTQRHFLFGLVSFLLAHVAYITAFAVHGIKGKWVVIAAVPALIATYFVMLWLAPHLPDELTMPVHAYIGVICIMVIMAFGSRGAGASNLIVVGAVLFFVSDLSVAAQKIVHVNFPTFVWGLPLYYAGQLCFAVGASHSSSHRGTPEK